MTLVTLPLAELLPEQGKRVTVDGKELAVFLLADGSVRAVLNRCPHKGGSLAEGIVSGTFVFCTQHDWKISLQDGCAQAPDEGCTTTYPCAVENGHVLIEVAS